MTEETTTEATEIDDSGYGLVFRVLPPYGEWVADGERFAADADGAEGGKHRLESPSADLARLAGAAHHAGVIEVTQGLDDAHVESQEDGEAAYAKAQEEGRWQIGNLHQAQIEEAQKLHAAAAREVDADPEDAEAQKRLDAAQEILDAALTAPVPGEEA